MPAQPLEAVIFDVDGTLFDSERDGHRVAFNLAFTAMGLPDRWDVATYGRLVKITGGVQRLTRWFEASGHSVADASRLAIETHRRKTTFIQDIVASGTIHPRHGAPELLNAIREAGVPVHVATTGTRAWVEPLLASAFGGCFDVVMTGTEVADLKPSPQVYREVLLRAGCDPARTVAIEDSANGLISATGAGLRCILARNDYTREDATTGAIIVTDELYGPEVRTWFEHRLTMPGRSCR